MGQELENRQRDTGGQGEGETNGKIKSDIYTLPRVKQTASGKLLHNTGSSAQRSVMEIQRWDGWRGLRGRSRGR